MKYKGPITQAPPEIREAAEAKLGPLPEDAWINVDLENRPEWIEITCKIEELKAA